MDIPKARPAGFWAGLRSKLTQFRWVSLVLGASGLCVFLFASIMLNTSYIVDRLEAFDPAKEHGPPPIVQGIGPTGQPQPGPNDYTLVYKYPDGMLIDDDAELTISVKWVSASYVGTQFHITPSSQSFKFNPATGADLSLIVGEKVKFTITATTAGHRSISIAIVRPVIVEQSSYRLGQQRLSQPSFVEVREPGANADIRVMDRPLFNIFDREMVKDIQMVAAIIGLPGLLIFGLTRLLDRRPADTEA